MVNLNKLQEILICPSCRRKLVTMKDKLLCQQCPATFSVNENGFIEFRLEDAGESVYEIDITTEDYVRYQESYGARVYREYLRPLLLQEPAERVLDVGCGIGNKVAMQREDGYDAYGIDLPGLSRYWARYDFSPRYFFCCDARRLPFNDHYFDFVYSLGVIEHVGTELGHCTLSRDYREVRLHFADELLRVTRPKGRIVIACPNKACPVDVQHTPADALTPDTLLTRIRSYLCQRTGINIHAPWGESHFLSYAEVKRLFRCEGEGRSFKPLPLKHYFGFQKFERGFLRSFMKLAHLYVNHLPSFLRPSFLNPYMLVQIRK